MRRVRKGYPIIRSHTLEKTNKESRGPISALRPSGFQWWSSADSGTVDTGLTEWRVPYLEYTNQHTCLPCGGKFVSTSTPQSSYYAGNSRGLSPY